MCKNLGDSKLKFNLNNPADLLKAKSEPQGTIFYHIDHIGNIVDIHRIVENRGQVLSRGSYGDPVWWEIAVVFEINDYFPEGHWRESTVEEYKAQAAADPKLQVWMIWDSDYGWLDFPGV